MLLCTDSQTYLCFRVAKHLNREREREREGEREGERERESLLLALFCYFLFLIGYWYLTCNTLQIIIKTFIIYLITIIMILLRITMK